ncbi:MAG: NifU family protein [Bacteroidetes bacterium]|nr:NifU family protein [Bacteroidota bacterium]MBU2585448.1 NifU family protein [Bacteroidota bacterium]
MEELRERIQKALDSVRPYLHADGGDVELVNVTEDGIVEVKLVGACGTCPMSQMTLRAGVERALMRSVPEIKRVEAVTG